MVSYDLQSIRKLAKLSVTMIVMVDLVAQVHSKENTANDAASKQNSMDHLVDKLAERAFTEWNLQLTHLDNTVLAKTHPASGIASTRFSVPSPKVSSSLQFSPSLAMHSPARSSLSASAFGNGNFGSSLHYQRGGNRYKSKTTYHSWRKAGTRAKWDKQNEELAYSELMAELDEHDEMLNSWLNSARMQLKDKQTN